MQLFGQISMFDQLTDYNDIDNDDELPQHLHSRLKKHRGHHLIHIQGGSKGEDEDDYGEEEAGNLYICRQRIQAINEELQNFITMMTDGEGGQGEDEGEDASSPEEITILNQETQDVVHNTSQAIDFGSRL